MTETRGRATQIDPTTSLHLTTTVTLDVSGNPTVVTDARSVAIQTQTFDMLGRPMVTHSPDGGDVTSFLDIAGQPLFLLKSGDIGIETEVDALRRKVRTWEWNTDTDTKVLRERFVYGEGTTDPEASFLRTRLFRTYDTAGSVELTYTWKGEVASTSRRFFADDEADTDWTVADTGDYPYDATDPDDATRIAAIEAAAVDTDAPLDGVDTYTVSTTYDALGHALTETAPDTTVTTRTYDVAGRLWSVAVGSDDYVTGITYNPKGQRLTITYSNSTDTAYTYDPDTFRLATLVTTRSTDSKKLQDLRYTYDPVGNIVGLENAADDDVYYDNTAVSPNSAFVYDALYRLVSATGREKGDRAQPWSSDPSFLDIPNTEELRTYTELYSYDEVGNISEMVHKHGATTLWTRDYAYATDSNRLASTTEVPGTVSYAHDAHGNMVYLPWMRFSSTQAPNVEVNFRDQMRKVYLNADDTAFYFYDSAGQRVRKVVKTGPVQDRKYVGGYEVWTKRSAGGTLLERRTTLHVMDDQARVAMIETKTDGTGAPLTRVRFQLGNHLGTACVEVNEDGEIISYEEYHPYGSTAWWSNNGDVEVSKKRYRYTGMERDEETGLQCHGVRYYAVWLGRWTSADPIGLGDGVNRFAYCHGGPVGGRDESGLADAPTPFKTPSGLTVYPNGFMGPLPDKNAIRQSDYEAILARDGGPGAVPSGVLGPLASPALVPANQMLAHSSPGFALGLELQGYLARQYPEAAAVLSDVGLAKAGVGAGSAVGSGIRAAAPGVLLDLSLRSSKGTGALPEIEPIVRQAAPTDPPTGSPTLEPQPKPAAAAGAPAPAPPPLRFGSQDLVYGPSARGQLRQLQETAGGRLLTDMGDKPPNMSWEDFSTSVLRKQVSAGGQIRFDLTNVQDLPGVFAKTGPYAETTTAAELRYIKDNWSEFEGHVTFYENGATRGVPW